MTFNEALKILNIEEYGDRIWNSNSHGELAHIPQYIHIAEEFKDHPAFLAGFPGFFKALIEYAEKEWTRPESVFQYPVRMLKATFIKPD